MSEHYTLFEFIIDIVLCILSTVDMINTHGIYTTFVAFIVIITISYLLDMNGVYIEFNPKKHTRWFIRGCLIGRYIK